VSEAPLVSIIMPVYNRAALIREAVDSVLASDIPLELIVVDDASTDETPSVLQSITDPRVRTVRMDVNSGQSAARNRGLDLAAGRYVKFLDSDDLLFADHLPNEVNAIRDAADIVVSGWAESGPDGFSRYTAAPQFGSIVDDVLAGLAVPTSSALYVRRPEWRWDLTLRKIDDWDYFCNAALGAKKIVTVEGAAYVMRHHAGERATNVGMLANAREHHQILRKIETRLLEEGRLTPPRRKRLAQYYYKELRVLSLHDWPAVDAALRHIFALDPAFRPRAEERSRAMRVLSRVIGARSAIRVYRLVKNAMNLRAARTSTPTKE